MTTTLTMKDLTIGTLVTVNDSTARNPGGYGRITRRSPKHGLVHVDSGEFPGQEVTGWYPIENVGLYAPTPEPAAAITDLKRIDHEIDRSSGRPQSEYWGYYDGELIGVRSTSLACEQMLDEHAYDLLSDAPSVVYARPAEESESYDDALTIPASRLDGQCGDCGTALNEYGQCERCIEEYIHDQGRYADMAADEPAPWERLTDRARPAELFCFFCGGDKADHNTRDCPKVDNFENTSPSVFDPPAERPADRPRSLTFHSGMSFSIRQPPRCACGATAIIDEPAGLFCNGCHEGYTLFELQKHDPTLLVQRLVAEPDRRNEMVARVARYLSHKHKMEVSPPTVLIIWRELLSDYEGPDAPLSLMLAA